MKRNLIIAIIGILAIVSLTGIYVLISGNHPETNPAFNPVTPNGADILIPVANLSTTAQFYSYNSDGTAIRYFLVKDQQGNVHGALDACDVCYAAKKGYRQNGDVMHCLNCGRDFSITSLGTDNTAGGCWPSHLPINISQNKVTIKVSDLVNKQFMFE